MLGDYRMEPSSSFNAFIVFCALVLQLARAVAKGRVQKSRCDIRVAVIDGHKQYLLAGARYVESNPVEAGIVEAAWDYSWSSVHAHLSVRSDGVVTVGPLLKRVDDWKGFIAASSVVIKGVRNRIG